MTESTERERIQKVCSTFGNALAEHLIGNGRGVEWPITDDAFLAMRCEQEVAELRYEIDYVGRTGAQREALDVGAFAMMIWDNQKEKKHASEG